MFTSLEMCYVLAPLTEWDSARIAEPLQIERERWIKSCPLHDIAITNIVWYMAYKRGFGRGAYIAQWSCSSFAIV